MSGMKFWQDLAIAAPADATIHEHSMVNPLSQTMYIRMVISARGGNCNCGAGSNFWVCLADSNEALITQHFNPADHSQTVMTFYYDPPIELAQGEHLEVGIYGTGNGGNMTGGTLIGYTLTA